MARFGRHRRRRSNPYGRGTEEWRLYNLGVQDVARGRALMAFRATQLLAASFTARASSIDDIVLEATREAAEHVLEVANTTVPLDTGFLRDSGEVVPSTDGSGWDVVYRAPYAEIQHESSHFLHSPGKRSHWLERTLEEEADNVAAIVESYVGEATGFGGGVGGRLSGFQGRERRISSPSRLF